LHSDIRLLEAEITKHEQCLPDLLIENDSFEGPMSEHDNVLEHLNRSLSNLSSLSQTWEEKQKFFDDFEMTLKSIADGRMRLRDMHSRDIVSFIFAVSDQ
jgi:hypothetical protein